jgi:hypothetical protein
MGSMFDDFDAISEKHGLTFVHGNADWAETSKQGVENDLSKAIEGLWRLEELGEMPRAMDGDSPMKYFAKLLEDSTYKGNRYIFTKDFPVIRQAVFEQEKKLLD